LTRLTLTGVDPGEVSRRLASDGIRLPAAAADGVITLAVNETWTRTSADDLMRAFARALD
ncbi:hypothetical protein, partial [Dyadobacter sp.]|uniref:hypothetical protein n=1 Tax=Dyadobacter sp. TaxID=1914288 RepID=UPI003F71E4C4